MLTTTLFCVIDKVLEWVYHALSTYVLNQNFRSGESRVMGSVGGGGVLSDDF